MRTREGLIQIRVTAEEREIIAANAERYGMEIAPYGRMVMINPAVTIVERDYSIIAEHTKELAAIRDTINRLIFTIDATNNYLPKDIKTIVNLMNEVFQTENKLLKTIREQS